MPLLPNRFRSHPLAHGYLVPLAALVLYGVVGWWSWRTGNLGFRATTLL